MPKGYQLIEPVELLPIITLSVHHSFAVAVYSWLIQQIKMELGNRINNVDIEIIPVAHHYPNNGYPLLGIHYHNGLADSEDIKPVVVSIISKVLNNKTIIDLINFIGTDNTDWKQVTSDIMNET